MTFLPPHPTPRPTVTVYILKQAHCPCFITAEHNHPRQSTLLSFQPICGWRHLLLRFISAISLFIFWSAGFYIRVVGRQSERKNAPILVGAPHSSFLEGLVVALCKTSPVVRKESKNAFVISPCLRILQSIFVDR